MEAHGANNSKNALLPFDVSLSFRLHPTHYNERIMKDTSITMRRGSLAIKTWERRNDVPVFSMVLCPFYSYLEAVFLQYALNQSIRYV